MTSSRNIEPIRKRGNSVKRTDSHNRSQKSATIARRRARTTKALVQGR